jgi:hypothetical protein
MPIEFWLEIHLVFSSKVRVFENFYEKNASFFKQNCFYTQIKYIFPLNSIGFVFYSITYLMVNQIWKKVFPSKVIGKIANRLQKSF